MSCLLWCPYFKLYIYLNYVYIIQFLSRIGLFHYHTKYPFQLHKNPQQALVTNKTAVKVMTTSVKEMMTKVKMKKKRKPKNHHLSWEETKHFNIFLLLYILMYVHTCIHTQLSKIQYIKYVIVTNGKHFCC